MKYFEFGQEHSELMVMLHGGGVSYLGMLPTAKKLAERYHVVLVAYDGFNPGEPETEFVSPMDEARRLGDYVVEHYGGKIDILYGISYGCRVLMEVLADKHLTVTTTIADGMGLRDYPNIKSKWGKDVYCFFFTGLFYAVMGHPGPRRKRFLAKISGRTLEEAERILYGRATWKSWRNQDYYLIGKKTDYSLFAKTDMHLWYGIKGSVDKKLSKNLGALKASGYPFAVKIFTDLGHGGLAGEHPEQFVQEVSAAHGKSLAGKGEENERHAAEMPSPARLRGASGAAVLRPDHHIAGRRAIRLSLAERQRKTLCRHGRNAYGKAAALDGAGCVCDDGGHARVSGAWRVGAAAVARVRRADACGRHPLFAAGRGASRLVRRGGVVLSAHEQDREGAGRHRGIF